MFKALIIAGLLLLTCQAQAEQITGAAKAIDSTTIQVGEQRVMLFGVDSVMRKQVCVMNNRPWQCWSAAVRALQALLDPEPVRCDTVGDADVYGRRLARCWVGRQSVNEELVAQGFAITRTSETSDYISAETTARQSRLGLWQGQFALPGDFRRAAGIFVERP